jgi:hypothetical protein
MRLAHTGAFAEMMALEMRRRGWPHTQGTIVTSSPFQRGDMQLLNVWLGETNPNSIKTACVPDQYDLTCLYVLTGSDS